MKQIAFLALCLPLPVLAAPSPDEIAAATYGGGPLPDGQSAVTAVVQTLLDRAGVSPGVIDGYAGGMSTSAIRALEMREGLQVDGVMDVEVWRAIGGEGADPVVQTYEVTEEDAEGLVDAIPEDYAKRAEMPSLGFVRVSERLAERFHMDEDFLLALNDGIRIVPGVSISVMVPGDPVTGEVARVEVDKAAGRLRAMDAGGNVLSDYPVGIGSDDNPSPTGTHEVVAVAPEPNYTYDPEANFQQGDNDEKLILPAGANNPVGGTWIDLSKPTYGIHGTPEPAKLFVSSSHGCVRMTNWDAEELSNMIQNGATVEFLDENA